MRSNLFFNKGLWTRFLAILALAFGLISVAQGQIVLPGVTVSPIGLSVNGWNQSSSIGSGYNIGGDGKGTVVTLADGFFRLGAESYLTGNSNPNCVADCSSTQAKLFIIGEQITGARSMNQGFGTLTSPVQSISGTNGMFNASLQTRWVFTPAPTATPVTP